MEEYSVTGIKNLFLRQSYIDAWNDYQRVVKAKEGGWDFVILTASNEDQAKGYQLEIDSRKQAGRIPLHCEYIVLPDPEGKRVGSGGATFHVLRYLAEKIGGQAQDCLNGKKVLVIHSGGDSKRVPQYSVCGKLFSPVPRELPNGYPSTLFDEFMISMTAVAGRVREGMLILSGDVLLLFNPLQLDFQFQGAAAISIKEPVTTGKEHGVFLRNCHGLVEQFLHKKSEEQLRTVGAVNTQDCVDLDTGAVLLDCQLISHLMNLITTDGKIDEQKYNEFVNEQARISFYGDFLYPLAQKATLEEYYEQAPEGSFCQELKQCRGKIWNELSAFSMKVICLSPAEFIHFGTTGELLELLTEKMEDYGFLDWRKSVCTNIKTDKFAIHNSYIHSDAQIGENSYIEDSYLGEDVVTGERVIISGANLQKAIIPPNTVVDMIRLSDGDYVARVYGIEDNPKGTYEDNAAFLAGHLKTMLDYYEIPVTVLWKQAPFSLWTARLYPVCENQQEAVAKALILQQMVICKASRPAVMEWLSWERTSLCESFNRADIDAQLPWKEELRNQILAQNFILELQSGSDYKKALEGIGGIPRGALFDKLMERAKVSDYKVAMRIYYALGKEQECFEIIRSQVFESDTDIKSANDSHKICKEKVIIELPLRVNWGGGWTDTPPYCNEQGGMVLNAAIKLNGIFPVKVELRKTKDLQIEFESADLNVNTVIHDIKEIQDCRNPYDFFALHKAALIACGIIPMDWTLSDTQNQKPDSSNGSEQLTEILRNMGGGIYLSTSVEGVPKGSGLGTSSILAGACAKAIAEFTGTSSNNDDLFKQVLCMEQIMSTGGGWQDQVGGLCSGIKMITSKPGIKQNLVVEEIVVHPKALQELQERFAIVYTGQRRLARNLLREVVGNYIGGRKESVEALEQMKEVAIAMKTALEKGNINQLAALFNRHWELSLQLDHGATNLCIDQIFRTIEDLIDGKFIAGAGGGGFLQIIMKKGVTREQINQRLDEVFQGTGVAVWDSEIFI